MENENNQIKKRFPLELLRAPRKYDKEGFPENESFPQKTEINRSQTDNRMDDMKYLNVFREPVLLREALESDEYLKSNFELPCVIGKSHDGYFVIDLEKMGHVLIGGASGLGKPTCIHAIIASLLYSKHPSELKFILIDPKNVEYSTYNLLDRQYLAKMQGIEDAVITETEETVKTLNLLCEMMYARYDFVQDEGCDDLSEYNEKTKLRSLSAVDGYSDLPYVIVIIDEFADLIEEVGREVEEPIVKLANLGGSVGIHLILSTQKPSFNVFTGFIRANFSTRIAFRVSSKTESRVILDHSGAESLHGGGDMLFCNGDDFIRIQGVDINSDEINAITKYISENCELDV